MGGRGRREVPERLLRVQQRLAAWRSARAPGDRIPKPLWRSVAKLALEYGFNPTAMVLKLDDYLLRRWDSLTLFLRKAGAPLDNHVCERALKQAILHRRNSMFYKTRNGARVGDIYMSLIYTCELNGVNALDYLNEQALNACIESRRRDDPGRSL